MDDMARIRTPNLGEQLGSLGEFIAAQRRSAQLTLRQLAEQTGVSNPYLSQIERGLRRPSAEVLQQLSKALRVSAETLYVRAGILDPDDHATDQVEMAVLADVAITERQKRVLIDVYTSFVKENEKSRRARDHRPDRLHLIHNTTQGEGNAHNPRDHRPGPSKAARESDYSPLYAVAGLTDAAADALRGALAESQERRPQADRPSCRAATPAVRQQVKHNAAGAAHLRTTLPEQFKAPARDHQGPLAELQTQANELLTEANAAYSDLAGRGKQAVDEALINARNLSERAEKLAEDVARRSASASTRLRDGAGRRDQGPAGVRPDRDRDRDPAERGKAAASRRPPPPRRPPSAGRHQEGRDARPRRPPPRRPQPPRRHEIDQQLTMQPEHAPPRCTPSVPVCSVPRVSQRESEHDQLQ